MSTGKTYSTKYLLDSNNNRGAEGQVLSTTSTGIDWVNANTVPGTGLWLANGNDIYNSNSGNVGIGTTSPGEKLQVDGAVKFGQNSNIPEAAISHYTNGYLYIKGGSSGLAIGNDDYNASIYLTNGNTVQISTSGSDRMIVSSSGNVGIGTTSPDSKLDVKGPSATPADGNQTLSITNTTGGTQLNIGTVENSYGWIEAREGATLRNLLLNPNGGNVGIGTTSPGAKLEIVGDSITRSKTRGLGTNYATSEGWVAGGAGSFTSRTGYFGGNFGINGPAAENKVVYDDGPFGSRELVWKTIPETGNNDDGGWNKSFDGFNNSANNGFMSIVYVRRDAGSAGGNFYHGCSGSNTLNLAGSADTNPYFSATGITILPADVWCVAIGIIYATNDTTTATSALGGIYRLDTGEKLQNATTYRQKTSNVAQEQRVYHYYSTSTTAQLDFANPGWYILDGSEPSLGEILGSGSADDAFWSANGNDIYNDNSGNVGIGTTSPDAKLSIKRASNAINTELSFIDGGGTRAAVIGIEGATTNDMLLSTLGGIRFYTASNVAVGSVPSNERMRITSAGNVGIGTTNPGSKLEVKTSGTNTTVELDNSDTDYTVIQYNAQGATKGFSGFNAGFMLFGGEAGVTTRLQAGGSYAATILTNGNFGIGTTSPSALFSVANTTVINGNGTAGWGSSANYGFLTWDGGTVNAAIVKGQNGKNLHLGAHNRNDDLVITIAGNVGIGVTGPIVPLHVSGAAVNNPSNGAGGYEVMQIFDTTSYATGVGGGIGFGGNFTSSNNTIFSEIRGLKENATNSNYAGALSFSTRLNGANITERMRITSAGNVGINNSIPNEKLSVRGNVELVGEGVGDCGIRYIKYNCPDDSTYNVLGLETSGLTIYNRALMPSNGAIIFQNQSNNNQYYIRNSGGTNATFQVGQGAPGSNVRFFINGSGNVGIGNTASTASVKLEVTGNTLLKNSNGVGDLYLGNYATANHFRFHTNNANTYFDMNCGDIYWRQGTSTRYQFFASTANMTIQGTLTQNSDARTKENVVEISDCISKVKAMRGVYYNRTDFNTNVTKVGVIAQEVEAVLPELVLESPETGLKSVAYSELTSVLINAIKEQQEIIEDLKTRITKLEN